ncbi:MAG: hypothetical protein IJ147_11950 [Lachnospiraceae bacterium]|nr:hypothetical protein [Lachnospiraceae bacterium]
MEGADKEPKLHSAVYSGDALRTYVADSGFLSSKRRNCLEELEDYLRGREKRVMGVCGLHRTGRTTLMCQAIDQLGLYADSLLVICSAEDSLTDLRPVLCEERYRYLFLDDMDRIPELEENCGFLAEELAQSGKKVVLCGGDGDELIRLKAGVLADKLHLLKTSYMSFREYQRLFGGSLEEYFLYQSEDSGERIREIALKYAEDEESGPDLSVFLGQGGRILKAMDALAEIPENGRSYHTTFTQPGLIGSAGPVSAYDEAQMREERLKDIVVTDLLKDPMVSGSNVIAKYRSDGGEVFDIVLINKKNRRCVAIRVEDTDRRAENQARDLTDKAVCKELQEYFGGRLVGRYVCYHGPAGRAFKVQYMNCTEFLGRGSVFREMMEKLEGN